MKVHKKNPRRIAGSMATMLLCSLLFSCNGEGFLESRNPEKACDNISFSISSDKDKRTRGYNDGNEYGRTVNRFVLRSDNSADTLCVRAIVSGDISVSSLEGEKGLTRGTPVSGNDNFYDKFHVLAYWKEKDATAVESRFFMDEDATKSSGDVWATEHTYYWPGDAVAFQFYAWAPTNAENLVTPSGPQSKELVYTVPAEVAAQKDIMVAAPENIDAWTPGNNNATVPFTFKHICTAVRFVVGSRMQVGSIKSVALKGVKYVGTYDMAAATWILGETTNDFIAELNKEIVESDTTGTEINTAESTFMMLPQTLPVEAKIEVVFENAAGETETLVASIANTVWTMGTTVTYKLSVTPEYDLEFISEPKVQDAHYVIYPITIKSDDKLPAGGWTLSSDDTENVTFVESGKFEGGTDVQALVDAGYWLDGYNGTSTLTSTTTGEVKVYVFLKENAGDSDRNITLSLKPTAQGNFEVQKFSFKQYCPAWNGNIGVERIQDRDYPWGFNWDSSMKIVYSMPVSGLWGSLVRILFEIFGDHSYIDSSGWAFTGNWKVTVDFSKVPALTTATSSTDGHTNTWQLYSFNGISEAETIMNQLESWGGVPDKTLPTNPAEFAARACAMKNKYRVETKTSTEGGITSTVYRPALDSVNMVWYLPAQNEAPNMKDTHNPLSGDYWTSTAITNPGTTAYKYTAGGSTSPEDRNTVIHVRAVRAKP